MTEVKELKYVCDGAGLCMEFSTSFPISWVLLQTTLFLTTFDTYSDWKMVYDFSTDGFDNPLLPRNDTWLYTWFVFASIGTILTLMSFLHDGLDLLYECRKKSPSSRGRYDIRKHTALRMAVQDSFHMHGARK